MLVGVTVGIMAGIAGTIIITGTTTTTLTITDIDLTSGDITIPTMEGRTTIRITHPTRYIIILTIDREFLSTLASRGDDGNEREEVR